MGGGFGLPFLETMMPSLALAAPSQARALPRRMAFVYVPNGVNMDDWTPRSLGTDYTLPRSLEPLASFKSDLLVLSGLTCDKARPNGDGPGDHARAMSRFLTRPQAPKTPR